MRKPKHAAPPPAVNECPQCTTPTRCGRIGDGKRGPRCVGRADGPDDCDCLNGCGDDPWLETGKAIPCQARRDAAARAAAGPIEYASWFPIAPGVRVLPTISREAIAEWRALQGQGMTSAVGEYTPPEFWTLLDAYETLAYGVAMRVVADPNLPPDVAVVRDSTGKELGRIVNIGTPGVMASAAAEQAHSPILDLMGKCECPRCAAGVQASDGSKAE